MRVSLADIDVDALSEQGRFTFRHIAVPLAIEDLEYKHIAERLQLTTRVVSRLLDDLATEIDTQVKTRNGGLAHV